MFLTNISVFAINQRIFAILGLIKLGQKSTLFSFLYFQLTPTYMVSFTVHNILLEIQDKFLLSLILHVGISRHYEKSSVTS